MNAIIDTVNSIINNTTTDNIDLIYKIDAFYNNAWDKLVFVVMGAFFIIGIFIPLIFHLYQKRTNKLSEELLKKDISDQTEKIEATLNKSLSDKINSKFTEYDKLIKKLTASSDAKTFFLQGKLNLEKYHYNFALGDFIAACFNCINAEDHGNLQQSLLGIKACLPYLSKEEVDDLKVSSFQNITLLLDELEKINDRGVFQTVKQEIKLKISKLPATLKDKPQEKAK